MLKSIFFTKNNDKSIVLDYLFNDVPKSTAFKLVQQMILLEEHGLKYGYVKYKKFQNGMFKIRLNDGNNNCRVYFFIIDDIVYYLYAYNKKTQKTHENIKIKINNLKTDLLNCLKDKKKQLQIVDLNLLIKEFL